MCKHTHVGMAAASMPIPKHANTCLRAPRACACNYLPHRAWCVAWRCDEGDSPSEEAIRALGHQIRRWCRRRRWWRRRRWRREWSRRHARDDRQRVEWRRRVEAKTRAPIRWHVVVERHQTKLVAATHLPRHVGRRAASAGGHATTAAAIGVLERWMRCMHGRGVRRAPAAWVKATAALTWHPRPQRS